MDFLIDSILNFSRRKLIRSMQRAMRTLYPDIALRSSAFFAEGMALVELEAFNAGEVVEYVAVSPDKDEGYHIEIVYKSSMEVVE